MIKHVLTRLLLVLFASAAYGKSNLISWEYNYDHFGIQNGLPSSETYQVYQDRSGLMWILTDRGIVRYDGFRFRTYTVENGLSDNVNFRVVEGPDGAVWFIGANGLLSVYRHGKMQEYEYNSTLLKIFPMGKNIFNSFCIDQDNSVIYSVQFVKVVSISAKGKVTELLSEKERLRRDAMNLFEFGDQFVNCNSVPRRYPTNLCLYRNKRTAVSGKFRFGGTTRVKKYLGEYFFISNKKLCRISDQRIITIPDPNEVISLDADRKYLYIGYYKNGLKKYRFDSRRKELVLVQHYLPQYSVSSAFRDCNGSLWMSTLEKGVFVIYDEAFKQLSQAGVNVDEEIRFVTGNKDKVVITYYVGKWQQLYPPYLLKNYGKTLDWNILVSYGKGFVFQEKILDWSDWPDVDDQYHFRPFYTQGSSLISIEPNADSVDVTRYGQRKSYSLKEVVGHKIKGVYLWFHFIPDKKIYFLMNEGVFSFDMTPTKTKGNYRNILRKQIARLKYYEGWGVLAYSNTEGVFRINEKNDSVSEFAPEIDLGKQVETIFSDEKKRLWVTTEKGIYLLTKKNGKTSLAKFLNRDLLSSREITDLYSYNDILYIATKFGVQKIDFMHVKKEVSENPFKLLSIRSFAKNRLLNLLGVYPAKTDLIKIALSNSSLNRRNVYRYRFRKDQTWTKSDKSEITLNDPVDGKYDLEVSYLNFSNEWSLPKHITTFEVEKIIFLRWYFILLYVVLILVLFYIVLKLSISSVNKKNYMVNRMIELERMALAAQMNPHFIFNSLNSIHSFLLYEENENAEKYLLRFARLIRQTLANSRMTYITVEDEYEALKNYILLENMRFKNAFTFEIACDLQRLPTKPCIPPMLIQPYVENAILHGLVKRSEGAELHLRFFSEGNTIKVVIEDNGVGYETSKKKKRDSKHKSYGTQITEERLKSMQINSNGEFTVSVSNLDDSNEEFPGTKVVLTIPVPTS